MTQSAESISMDLAKMERYYVCSDTIAESMSGKNQYRIIGPFCVGKSTIMEQIQLQSDDFIRVKGFTTRPMRIGETEEAYDFYEHDIPTLSSIREQVYGHELVQYTVSPHTGYVYGSKPEAYAKPNVLLDTMAAAAGPADRGLTFKKTTDVYMVTSNETIRRRLAGRAEEVSASDMIRRTDEAIFSLEWALDQPGSHLTWLVNDQPIEAVTQKFLENTTQGVSDPEGREYARDLLAGMRELRKTGL